MDKREKNDYNNSRNCDAMLREIVLTRTMVLMTMVMVMMMMMAMTMATMIMIMMTMVFRQCRP